MSSATLRARLLLLVLLAVVPALALSLYSFAEQRRQAAAEAYADALQLVRQASFDQDQLILNARQLLVAMAQHPAVRNHDASTCSTLASSLVGPVFINVGAATPDGNIFCSALPLTDRVNIADRAYFQRATSQRDFAIGEYQIGRITGKPSINAGYPVIDARGRIHAVVFVAMDLSWLNQIAAAAKLPAGSTLTVLDTNGTVLARHPDPDYWVGRLVPEAPLLKAIAASTGEGVAQVPGLDGAIRLYGFATLPSSVNPGKVHVAVGIPTQSAFAAADREFAQDLTGLGLVIAMVLVVGLVGSNLLVLQPVNAVVAAARRLSAGDLTARTRLRGGPRELNQLGRAFDEMAQALEERTGSLHEAQVHYRALVEQSLTGVYLIAGDRLAYINEAGARIFGYQPDEIIGRLHPTDLVHPDDRLLVAKNLQARLTGEVESLRYMSRGVRKDGGIIHCEVFGRKILYQGQPAVLGTLLDITERIRAEEQVQRQLQQLAALRMIDLAITASLDLRVTLNVLLDQVIGQLHADAADILLLDPHIQVLEYAAGRGFRSNGIARSRLHLGEGHAGRAALERRMVNIPRLPEALGDFLRAALLADEEFVTYYAVPLIAKGQVKGVLEVFHRTALEPDTAWLNFLEALAGQAAIAVDNAALFNDLQRANVDLTLSYDTTLEGWSRALDLRDKETEGHTIRVTELTLDLARAMGMSEAELVHVRRGALLHDIGKMGIPDSILLKPGPLTEDEWVIMRKHPVYAYELLNPIPYLRPALDIPYCHHERWDGAGYPRGMKDEQIPLAARIFAVIDVWDALTSHRPYRPAWPEEKTRGYILEQAGKHFDPRVVDAFLRLNIRTEHLRPGGSEIAATSLNGQTKVASHG